MFSKSASHLTHTAPKLELIAGGLASHTTSGNEVIEAAAREICLGTTNTTVSPEQFTAVMNLTRDLISHATQGAEVVIDMMGNNLASMNELIARVSEKARAVTEKEKSLKIAMQALVQTTPTIITVDGQQHLFVSSSKVTECASLLAKTLKLPCFFAHGIGLVEVEEEPLFGGWRCSPVPVAEVAKALRAKVHLHWLQGLSKDQSAGDLDLYDHFAKVLAGSRTSNAYFPELKGEVFVGHKMSDGRVLKRPGYDKRSGFFVRSRKPFHAVNDEAMAVAA